MMKWFSGLWEKVVGFLSSEASAKRELKKFKYKGDLPKHSNQHPEEDLSDKPLTRMMKGIIEKEKKESSFVSNGAEAGGLEGSTFYGVPVNTKEKKLSFTKLKNMEQGSAVALYLISKLDYAKLSDIVAITSDHGVEWGKNHTSRMEIFMKYIPNIKRSESKQGFYYYDFDEEKDFSQSEVWQRWAGEKCGRK